jgi:hypothetical protein
MRNILTSQQKKDLTHYIDNHHIVPSDFDDNEKVRTYVYYYIEVLLSLKQNKSSSIFFDVDYYLNDLKPDIWLRSLEYLKNACGRYIKNGERYGKTLLNKKIDWITRSTISSYTKGKRHTKYGTSFMGATYEPITKVGKDGHEYEILEDTSFLPGDIYTDLIPYRQAEEEKVDRMLNRNGTHRFSVKLFASNRIMYFKDVAEVTKFFDISRHSVYRLTYDVHKTESRADKDVKTSKIKSIKKLNRRW